MSATRAGTVYLAANLASAGVPFLLLPLLTRVLPPQEFGAVVNFMLLMAASSAFAGLSVHGALGVAWFREQPQDLARLVGTALAVAVASTLLMAFLLACIVAALGSDQLGFGPGLAALSAVAAGANVLLQCRLVLWQSAQRPWPNAVTQVIGSAVNVSLSIIGVLVLAWGGVGRMAGVAGSSVIMAVAAVVLLAMAGQVRFELRRRDFVALVAFGAPLIPHAVAGIMLSTADRFVVSARLGTESLGTYGAAAQIGAVMAIVADAFVKALNPWLYARLQSAQPYEALRAVGAIYLSIPGFFGLALMVGVVLILAGPLMLGPEYRDAIDVIPWFVVGGAFSGMYLAVSGLYFFHGRTAMLSIVSFPSALLGVLATIALVALCGVRGAAAGYALTQAILAIAAWTVARHAFALPWRRPAAALAAWRHGTAPARQER